MKQYLTCLLLSLLPMAGMAHAADPVCKISLDARPTYGPLAQTGLKFLNPEASHSSAPRQVSPKPSIKLSAEAATVHVQFQGASVNLAHCDSIWVNFNGDDLNPPGKYYPSQPPVIDSTPVEILSLGSDKLTLEDTRKIFASVASAFKWEQNQVNAWFDNRLWELTTEGGRMSYASIKLSKTFPEFSIEYYILPKRVGDTQEVTFETCLRIKWMKARSAKPLVLPGVGP